MQAASGAKKMDLTGSWRVVYAELNGEMTPVAHFSGIEMQYTGDKFQILVHGELKHHGTYAIDESVTPAKITYIYDKSSFYETGKPRIGIIQLIGDTFKDCLGAIGAAVPPSFNTSGSSNTVLTVHQRTGVEGGKIVADAVVRRVSEW